ncbi:MAG: peptide chain release factor 1 [Candidatus Omnitrophica bacterium]|nr:peptide chain release factor 1 [Candidatus Omnitrophota bacterium]MBU4478792.1 peptide chain release factor 1 [Candidatus Omnitrophota bacterium]MCG2703681.1 peptide chain release factor 1 [Candidatus Omnitrophota bacterium]
MQNKGGLFSKFKELEDRFQSLEEQMISPDVVSNAAAYQKIAKERASLLGRIEKFREYKKVSEEIERLNKVVRESKEEKEFLELVAEELQTLRQKHDALLLKLEEYLIEPDPDEDRNIIVEIRAGTGGEEAALFVANLYRMYTHYADACGFRVELINSNPTPLGGFKEIIFSVSGDKVYKKFKFESGVHRVQRVPSTEASGRIHTSAVSVAVLTEAEEMDIEIDPGDLKIDVFRAAGAGGQHVNTTDSAVRLTHLPTGVVVTCQDERSQIKNRAKALKVLRARLLDHARRQQESKISRERKNQIGTGDRSEKIRTYNFPDRRVTDHRIGLTLYRIEQILEGDLEEIVSSLQEAQRQLKLKGTKQD